MKGILLAGGSGSRMHPLTQVVNKHLLPVYDKPMIYYPLSALMLAGIREILVITTPRDRDAFRALFGDGSAWGLSVRYAVQEHPNGIAEAFIIAGDFIGDAPVALALGDNIFYGQGLPTLLRRCAQLTDGAIVLAHAVADPQRYGVVEFDGGRPRAIIEKPSSPPSPYAVTGLYFYDAAVRDIARGLRPSRRGELEITDVNNAYLRRSRLQVERLGRGFAWLDTGTPDSLLRAAEFIEALETRQGMRIAVPEEIAWRLGYIDTSQLVGLAHALRASPYGAYLAGLLSEKTATRELVPAI
jgi:glucose-1-phosphate thymidylyltransferase